MEQFTEGLGDAWAATALFVPKLIGFLLVLLLGYLVAKVVEKAVDKVLERVGFDRWVERGGVKKALEASRYDASSLLGRLAFYVVFLFVLQLAFGVFGENPISDLITSVIAYLPKVFAAIVILVVGSALAAAVKEIVEAALGGLSYGRGLALGASVAVLMLAIFAALAQLQIAQPIVLGLFYAILAIVVGSSIVAIGGGGIATMQRYWERGARRLEEESDKVRKEAKGADERVRRRVETRVEQARGGGRRGGRRAGRGEGEAPAPSPTAEAAAPAPAETATRRSPARRSRRRGAETTAAGDTGELAPPAVEPPPVSGDVEPRGPEGGP